tara:strand:- start:1938 stop:2819 length:882 start_codon:yes stop_codon:yes gene_type:complete
LKGIILAGGSGTRLYPITKGISKQLIPISGKPMIYYPLSTLITANITEILIISTPIDLPFYERLLGDGSNLGLKLSYKVQPEPKGLSQAFILGKEFIGSDDVALILGDNIFYGSILNDHLSQAKIDIKNLEVATIFGYSVSDPQRYGVAEFDDNDNVISLEEKPKNPKSNYAIVGLYFYPNDVIELVKTIEPSDRGELEITTLNQEYLNRNRLKIKLLESDSVNWLDTGTHRTLVQASEFISTIEDRTGKKIGCIEELCYLNGNISKNQLMNLGIELKNNEYGKHIIKVASGK